MKLYKYLVLLLAASTLLLSACNGDDDDDNDNPTPVVEPTIIDCADGDISGDVTWTNDPEKPVDYRVTCEVTLVSGGNLTIEPGTVIEFTENGSFFFSTGSEFHFNGTSSDSISLIGTQAQPGHWSGFEIWSDNPTNNMDFVNVRDAGSTGNPSFTGVMRLRL